ncbi:hypothetical protein [uncultured Planktomarina sp.]|uniref:hypothetical protein n=1 Tax=uncultured Planktomarina sp. TaxID=1538529 RepID=UPI003260B53A
MRTPKFNPDFICTMDPDNGISRPCGANGWACVILAATRPSVWAVDSQIQNRQIAAEPNTRNRAFRGRQTDEECP